MKRATHRQLALYGALAASLAATAWVARQDDEPAGAAAPPARRDAHTRAAPPADAGGWPGPAASARAAWPPQDKIARSAWGEAAPVPPTAHVEPPPMPRTPPFPYQFVGRMTDVSPRAVLNNAQRSAVVAVGDTVDGQWRVDAIETNGLRLKFLPLGQAQFVPFAGPSA